MLVSCTGFKTLLTKNIPHILKILQIVFEENSFVSYDVVSFLIITRSIVLSTDVLNREAVVHPHSTSFEIIVFEICLIGI